MDITNAREAFEEYLASQELQLAELDAANGIDVMLAFYLEQRPSKPDEDDLLFQWGAYDWGEGEFFELDLTRQFTIGGEADDDNIWQLSLKFKYRPDDELRQVESGNRWCGTSALKGVEYFKQWIQKSPGFLAVGNKPAHLVELLFGSVG